MKTTLFIIVAATTVAFTTPAFAQCLTSCPPPGGSFVGQVTLSLEPENFSPPDDLCVSAGTSFGIHIFMRNIVSPGGTDEGITGYLAYLNLEGCEMTEFVFAPAFADALGFDPAMLQYDGTTRIAFAAQIDNNFQHPVTTDTWVATTVATALIDNPRVSWSTHNPTSPTISACTTTHNDQGMWQNVRYVDAIPGDVDRDGDVDINDYLVVLGEVPFSVDRLLCVAGNWGNTTYCQ